MAYFKELLAEFELFDDHRDMFTREEQKEIRENFKQRYRNKFVSPSVLIIRFIDKINQAD